MLVRRRYGSPVRWRKSHVPGWAEVDERRGRLYVLSWSSMGRGSRGNGWVRDVSATAAVADLGALVRVALAESRVNVPMVNFRDPAQSPTTPLLTAAGVKSWNGYALSMRACFIDFDNIKTGYLLRPTRNLPREGMIDLADAQFRVAVSVTDAELGAAVFTGLNRSHWRPAYAAKHPAKPR